VRDVLSSSVVPVVIPLALVEYTYQFPHIRVTIPAALIRFCLSGRVGWVQSLECEALAMEIWEALLNSWEYFLMAYLASAVPAIVLVLVWKHAPSGQIRIDGLVVGASALLTASATALPFSAGLLLYVNSASGYDSFSFKAIAVSLTFFALCALMSLLVITGLATNHGVSTQIDLKCHLGTVGFLGLILGLFGVGLIAFLMGIMFTRVST